MEEGLLTAKRSNDWKLLRQGRITRKSVWKPSIVVNTQHHPQEGERNFSTETERTQDKSSTTPSVDYYSRELNEDNTIYTKAVTTNKTPHQGRLTNKEKDAPVFPKWVFIKVFSQITSWVFLNKSFSNKQWVFLKSFSQHRFSQRAMGFS